MKVTLYVPVEHLIARVRKRLTAELEALGKATDDLEKAKAAFVQDPGTIQHHELMVSLHTGDVDGSKSDLALLEAAQADAAEVGAVKVEIEI